MEPRIKVNVGTKGVITVAIIIAIISIGGFATIAGGDFLNPSIALAKIQNIILITEMSQLGG